jgi:hypothetical protein
LFGPDKEGKGKFGYVDKTGKTVIEAKYERAGSFSEGFAAVMIDGKTGFIDKSGKLAIKAEFEEALPFSNSLAAVKADGKWGYVDKKGEFAVKPTYDKAASFRNKRALVTEESRTGYITTKGEYVWRQPEKKTPRIDTAAAEASAISLLRTFSAAEELYRTRYGKYATLQQLIDKNLIDRSVADGEKNGYYVDIDNPTETSWSAVAWPIKPGETGTRSYYISEDGVIYYKKCLNLRDPLADRSGKPLGR